MLRPAKRKRFLAPALAGARPAESVPAVPAKRVLQTPAAAVPTAPVVQVEDTQEPLYFSVLYTKYAPSKLRKNKTWMDGVLEVRYGRPHKCVLFEDSSRQLAQSKLSGTSPADLGAGSEVLVGGWELEVQERQPRDRFLSGDLFDSATGGGSTGAIGGGVGTGMGGRSAKAPGGLGVCMGGRPAASGGSPALRAFRAPLPGHGVSRAPGAPVVPTPSAPSNPFSHLPHDPRAPGALCLWHRGEEPAMESTVACALSRTFAQARAADGQGGCCGGGGGGGGGGGDLGNGGLAGSGPGCRIVASSSASSLLAAPSSSDAVCSLLASHPPCAVVDPHLSRHLLPHQREGVAFLFRCVSRGGGAILADEMGLGKTLQAIALLWTLLRQGGSGGGGRVGSSSSRASAPSPCVRKVLVVAPTTLVRTWASECRRWLGSERLRVRTLDPGPEAASVARDFAAGRTDSALLASYEMARAHAGALKGCIGLLICDEAHRLKASKGSKSLSALAALGAPRRVLLTGTPAQNAPRELFALAEFAAPGSLGSLASFERLFGKPIERARDRAASPEEVELGRRRGEELARRVAGVVLRRTAEVQERLLPPCVVRSLFCALTDEQTSAYITLLCGERADRERAAALAEAKRRREERAGGVAALGKGETGGGDGNARKGGSLRGLPPVFRGRGVAARGVGGTEVLSTLGRLRRICIDAALERNGGNEEDGEDADGEEPKRGEADEEEEEEDVERAQNASEQGDDKSDGDNDGDGDDAEKAKNSNSSSNSNSNSSSNKNNHIDTSMGAVARENSTLKRSSDASSPGEEAEESVLLPSGSPSASSRTTACDARPLDATISPQPGSLRDSFFSTPSPPSSSPPSSAPLPPAVSRLTASSSKLRVLAAIARAALSSDPAGKIVVVSQYVSALDLAASLFEALGVGCVRLDGSTPAKLRADVVERFQRPLFAGKAGLGREPSTQRKGISSNLGTSSLGSTAESSSSSARLPLPVRAFLLSTSAGGVGLTLTAASTLVLLDPHWNPALDAQAMARIWRPGQRRACRIFRLFAAGSIDEKILQRQIRKGEVAGGLGVRERAAKPGGEAGEIDEPGSGLNLFDGPQASAAISAASSAPGRFSDEELKELFTFRPFAECETADLLGRAGGDARFRDELEEYPTGNATLPGMLGADDVITAAARAGGDVRFVHVDELKGNADMRLA